VPACRPVEVPACRVEEVPGCRVEEVPACRVEEVPGCRVEEVPGWWVEGADRRDPVEVPPEACDPPPDDRTGEMGPGLKPNEARLDVDGGSGSAPAGSGGSGSWVPPVNHDPPVVDSTGGCAGGRR
jgi:hypothetical protein